MGIKRLGKNILKELYHKINVMREREGRYIITCLIPLQNTFQEIGNLQWHNFLINQDNHGIVFTNDLNRKLFLQKLIKKKILFFNIAFMNLNDIPTTFKKKDLKVLSD